MNAWKPPSDSLHLRGNVWCPLAVSSVSYPETGNEECFQVEDESYWFEHRNTCLLKAAELFPFEGTFYDIGGGNGFVAAAFQRSGCEVVLLEPGLGAFNAVKRGVSRVVHCALDDAGFLPGTLDAAGAFDVVEHIEDDVAFLSGIRRLLRPGGRFYCTVPAMSALWSDEDIHAGHYRRYSKASLTDVMQKTGFEVEFLTGIFAWLTLPVFLLRALPFRLWGGKAEKRGSVVAVQSDHTLPGTISGLVGKLHQWELSRLGRRCPIPFGTSLLCVARAPLS